MFAECGVPFRRKHSGPYTLKDCHFTAQTSGLFPSIEQIQHSLAFMENAASPHSGPDNWREPTAGLAGNRFLVKSNFPFWAALALALKGAT